MNNFKKLALSLLLAMPMVASASGMGIYIPYNISETEELEYTDGGGTYDFEYKPSAGIGFVFDTNIGKDKLFNYRLGLEYVRTELDNIDGNSLPAGSTFDKSTFNIVNTFGFGLLRTQTVRLWVGPRVNVQFENADFEVFSISGSQSSIGVGLGLAAGVNVNLGKVVSLAADLDYHAVSVVGTEDFAGFTEEYTAVNKGATIRFYVLFKFGETFDTAPRPAADQGVVDQSL
jgi:hypothetical protein